MAITIIVNVIINIITNNGLFAELPAYIKAKSYKP
jgi:hypothetical protein